MGHPFQSEDFLIEVWDGETWLGALGGHANQDQRRPDAARARTGGC